MIFSNFKANIYILDINYIQITFPAREHFAIESSNFATQQF